MFTLNKRTLSAAAVIAAVSAPSTAAAMPFGAETASSGQQAPLRSYQQAVAKSFGPTSGGLAGPTVRVHAAHPNSARSSSVSSPEGFQWDDAGIGAAGILALLTLGAGSVAAITRRRTRPTRVS